MRNRSPANKAASSPPVPARISSIAARSSAASRGSSFSARARSASGNAACSSAASSSAIWRMSGLGSTSMSLRISSSARIRRTSRAAAATGSISA
jgi:hypothetical protein